MIARHRPAQRRQMIVAAVATTAVLTAGLLTVAAGPNGTTQPATAVTPPTAPGAPRAGAVDAFPPNFDGVFEKALPAPDALDGPVAVPPLENDDRRSAGRE